MREHVPTDRCHFCRTPLPADMETVAAEGWVPSFYDGQTEYLSPVCGVCFGRFVRVGVDGEVETTAAGRYVLLQSRSPRIARFN